MRIKKIDAEIAKVGYFISPKCNKPYHKMIVYLRPSYHDVYDQKIASYTTL